MQDSNKEVGVCLYLWNVWDRGILAENMKHVYVYDVGNDQKYPAMLWLRVENRRKRGLDIAVFNNVGNHIIIEFSFNRTVQHYIILLQS